MRLRVGDRLTDETGEWEVASRPYTTNAGNDAHARVKEGSASRTSPICGRGARTSA